jgi:hypothetical protein
MSFDRLLNSQAVVMRLTGSTDTYGNVERAFTAVATIRVRLDVSSSVETTDDRESTTQTGVVYTREHDVRPSDLLNVDSVAWEVSGVPIPRFSPASLHHYEIPVRRANS